MLTTTQQRFLIGQLAKAAGVKSDTVRFYEKQGLLPKSLRAANAYRVYDEAALSRLRFIKQAQALGFTLDEIRRILNLRGQGKETCRCVVAMAEATLEETGRKLEELQAFHDALKKPLARWHRLSHRRDALGQGTPRSLEAARLHRAGRRVQALGLDPRPLVKILLQPLGTDGPIGQSM